MVLQRYARSSEQKTHFYVESWSPSKSMGGSDAVLLQVDDGKEETKSRNALLAQRAPPPVTVTHIGKEAANYICGTKKVSEKKNCRFAHPSSENSSLNRELLEGWSRT